MSEGGRGRAKDFVMRVPGIEQLAEADLEAVLTLAVPEVMVGRLSALVPNQYGAVYSQMLKYNLIYN